MMTPQYVISQLLEADASKYPKNLSLLKKIIITAYLGRLQINGLPPDNKIALGNYLFDNEKMIFDFTRLNDEKRHLFYRWFLEPHQKDKTKSFSTNARLNEYRGFTCEVSLTWWGKIKNWFQNKYSDHWKIRDLDFSLKSISYYQLTGIEMFHGNQGILIGFNQFLVPGTGTKYKDPNDSQQEPLGNTKRVFITDKLVDSLITLNLKNIKFESVCKGPHPQSIEVIDLQERLDKMYDYRQMQRFISLKPWYIRMWGWLFPWIKEEQERCKAVKDKHVVPLHQTKKLEIFRFLNSNEILVREKKPDIENIVLCGGGAKIFAHVGVYKALNEANIHPQKFAGSSAGAIIALMGYLGYSANEMEELFKHYKQEHLIHFDINFNGISDPHSLKTAIDFAIVYKLNQITTQYNMPYPEEKITFATLEAIRQKYPDCGIGKELVVTATNKRRGKTRYFSLLRSPHFEVSEAVKISASFPIVYRSTVIDGEEHNDGGVLNNFPTEAFFDDHSTLLESEYGNNLKVLAVKFDEGPERKAIDRSMEHVYRENIFLNWVYRFLTGVSDPASGWERDRLKLRKYACQSIVVNIDNISSSSFSVNEEKRKQMIDLGYTETKSYLDIRYWKNELEEYENDEFMYTTFSSLGELLSYCCYRGDKYWFEIVYELIEQSTAANRVELLKQAQQLKTLYFNPNISKLNIESTRHQSNSLTFFGNEVEQKNTSSTLINHKILLTVYPVFLKISPKLLRDSTDKRIFDIARHSLSLHSPFVCLEHFAKIGNEIHVILHIIINLLKELKNNPSEKIYNAFDKIIYLLQNNKNINSEECFSRWNLTLSQSLDVLQLLIDDSPHLFHLIPTYKSKEFVKTEVEEAFCEEFSDQKCDEFTFSP